MADTPEQAMARYTAALVLARASLPQDAGNRGLAEGWAEFDHPDGDWKTMTLPTYWSMAGHATNGVFWFRRIVDIPEDWAGYDLLLGLGAADKNDDTYFNGQRVGGMTWAQNIDSWKTLRHYTVPAKLVRRGRNVIAVRVMSNYTGGGLVGPGSDMNLRPAGQVQTPIALQGEWRYKIEQDFGLVKGIVVPAVPLGQNLPTSLFNAMIAPLIPYAIRGAIWYQGESNAADAARYHTLFPTLIRDWRRRWGIGPFPFYFVQLANYGQANATPESDDSRWAELREAQSATRALANTGMAVTIDIGQADDIHPLNKRDVGLRLALNAMAMDYGQKVPHRGPCYRSLRKEENVLRLDFDHAQGLTGRDGKVLGFAVAGEDRVFHAAVARIEGSSVLASSPKVAAPLAARYGWADCPNCTLYNAAGLPAEPFRTDNWPVGPKLADRAH